VAAGARTAPRSSTKAARRGKRSRSDSETVTAARVVRSSAQRASTGSKNGAHVARTAGHRREIAALVLLAVAVFLAVVVVAEGVGGVLGRAAATGLGYVLGHLALLVPLALVAVAISLVLERPLRRSPWFIGGWVFLFGVFLLVAAGAPPFGHHGADYFVRSEFTSRAGVVGEALYALFHRLSGPIGVALLGWVAALAGLMVATGMTWRRFAARTRAVAESVRQAAAGYRDRAAEDYSRLDEWAGAGLGGQAWRGKDGSSPLPLGPVDLVGGAGTWGEGQSRQDQTPASGTPFQGEFEEWAIGQPGLNLLEHNTSTAVDPGTSPGVIDGARVFSDLYAESGGPVPAGTAAPKVGDDSAKESAVSRARPAGDSGARGIDAERAESGGISVVTELAPGQAPARQEPLPGLEPASGLPTVPAGEPVYVLPDADWLRKSVRAPSLQGNGEKERAAVILATLGQFGVEARVVGTVVGPRVTRYELQLAPGIKVAKVASLRDDLAYALATTEIRILTPIPGKSAVGIEVPNQRADFVTLGDIYRDFPKSAGPLMVWLGKDISGKAVYTDLTQLPHLLIAGTTGSGKSGCVNCIVSSILLRATPEQVRFVMIDPKKVELSHYDRIPHLLVPVVTNMKDAAGVLYNLIEEMEHRYELMELEHARSLPDTNKARLRRGERPLPYIVVVIDELADLMMVSPQEVEDYVIRLAQKARAVGIHLVVATQRPSADVITGMIKANIPSRIAFSVSSQTDSRVILDVNGAEALLGRGDMLFRALGSSHLQRIQGAYITEEEIEILVTHWRRQAEPEFREELLRRPPDAKELRKAEDELYDPDSDDLLADAAQLVIETGSASVSMLQRRLRVGYTRAGRLIDMLERRGIVGPWEGSKPRQILVDPEEVEEVIAALRAESRVSGREDRTYAD